jgi:hypothetical protein
MTQQRNVSKEQRVRVEEWMTNAFVKLNARIKWCPRVGCDKAVEYGKLGMKTVTCECGHQFCFGCGNEAHDPAPCKVFYTFVCICRRLSHRHLIIRNVAMLY